MNPFPVSDSTLSPVHVGLFIQEHYFPDDQVHCQILKTGISDTYLVHTGSERYIFRIYSLHWRTLGEIAEELRLLRYLHDNGISVSFPISDNENAAIQTFAAPEGERYGVLFSYAEGKKVLNFDVDIHFRVGQMMAQMHMLTENYPLKRVTYTEQELLIDPLVKLGRFLSADTEEMQYMKRIQHYLVNEYRNADLSKIRTGAVHLDIWFDNMNLTTDGNITFFDFDFCGNGWLCLDLAYYILQVHSTEKDEAECSQKKTAFLEGYESVSPLSDEEKRLIPMLGVCMYFFYLGIQAQRYDNWSNVFLNEVYLTRFINLLVKKYFDHHQLGQTESL